MERAEIIAALTQMMDGMTGDELSALMRIADAILDGGLYR